MFHIVIGISIFVILLFILKYVYSINKKIDSGLDNSTSNFWDSDMSFFATLLMVPVVMSFAIFVIFAVTYLISLNSTVGATLYDIFVDAFGVSIPLFSIIVAIYKISKDKDKSDSSKDGD